MSLLGSILTGAQSRLSPGPFLLCTLVSLVLGLLIALAWLYRNTGSRGFAVTLVLLPMIVQIVIMLVNGNLGTGVAVMGAFSLIRFRSAPGSARDICSIFLAMAAGLATGMGYLGVAALTVLVADGVSLLLTLSRFAAQNPARRTLHVTIPEQLDYTEVFDEVFRRFLKNWELTQVRTSHMGSLYKLSYDIQLRDPREEKTFLDELRCRNGNLDISCGRVESVKEEL